MTNPARQAASCASKLDFYLLGACIESHSQAQRDADLFRAFRKFVPLLDAMRDLKRAHPAIYKAAEDDWKTAVEVQGKGG